MDEWTISEKDERTDIERVNFFTFKELTVYNDK